MQHIEPISLHHTTFHAEQTIIGALVSLLAGALNKVHRLANWNRPARTDSCLAVQNNL